MYLYIIFCFITLFALREIALNRKNVKSSNSKIIYVFFIILFVILSACRWENGPDWDSYYVTWTWFPNISIKGELEPGYILLTSINHWLVNDYSFHILIMALITIVPVSIINYRYSPYPLFSLYVWYVCYIAHIFNVRQTIAISLIFCSIPLIINRKFIHYFIVVLISCLIHKTAFVALPIYWLWKVKINKNTAIICLIICCIISLFISNFIINFITILGGELFEAKLNFYLNEHSDSTFGQKYSPLQMLIRGLFNRGILLILGFYLLDKIRKKNYFINGIINIYYCGTIVFFILTPLSPAFARLITYYDLFQIILIPSLFLYKMKKNVRFILFIIVASYLFFRFRGVVLNYEDLYIPYNFFFNYK